MPYPGSEGQTRTSPGLLRQYLPKSLGLKSVTQVNFHCRDQGTQPRAFDNPRLEFSK